MHRSRMSLAALSAAYLSGFAFASTSRANTTFTDYTGADPLFKKFTLNAGPDDVGPGAATTDGKKPDTAVGDPPAGTLQAQAEHAAAGVRQADGTETGAKPVGDPPDGQVQQS